MLKRYGPDSRPDAHVLLHGPNGKKVPFRRRAIGAKHLHILDPLSETNNLGRSVSLGNFARIRAAFRLGAERLKRLEMESTLKMLRKDSSISSKSPWRTEVGSWRVAWRGKREVYHRAFHADDERANEYFAREKTIISRFIFAVSSFPLRRGRFGGVEIASGAVTEPERKYSERRRRR